jgi:hypothetical protein
LPYDPEYPVVCVDERPCQLISDTVEPIAPSPGKNKRVDYHYLRHGTCAITLAIEPLTGKRIVQITDRRRKQEYTDFMELIKKEYDLDKNGEPFYELWISSKKNAFHWICINNPNHKWKSNVYNRWYKGSSCPYCYGHKVSEDNNLQKLYPELTEEWDFELNDKLPEEYRSQANKKVNWICKNNPKHKWIANISKRVNGNGCPYCSNKKIDDTNNLTVLNPILASEWDYSKNTIDPKKVAPSAKYKVWWICKLNHGFEATVNNRAKGRNCPHCYKNNRKRK